MTEEEKPSRLAKAKESEQATPVDTEPVVYSKVEKKKVKWPELSNEWVRIVDEASR